MMMGTVTALTAAAAAKKPKLLHKRRKLLKKEKTKRFAGKAFKHNKERTTGSPLKTGSGRLLVLLETTHAEAYMNWPFY
jgi:hypothetical protein